LIKTRARDSSEKAADMANKEYRNDKELTAFCALDSEDF
jgi:hypothetical protein